MKPVLLDCTTAVASLVVFILALIVLPALIPAAYAYILSVTVFIFVMSFGGYMVKMKM